MRFENACIPYGAYWSSPFCRWQGAVAHLDPIPFAADIARRALGERKIDPAAFTGVALGITVPQRHAFYGAPWFAGLIGATGVTGPTIMQACATSARVLATAAAEAELGKDVAILAACCDRTSNGPHVYYPNPAGPGGKGDAEDWVLDNFNLDPFAGGAMIDTAEKVVSAKGIARKDQEEVSLLRHAQYQDALAKDASFHRRYLVAPLEVKDRAGRKVLSTLAADDGPRRPTAESLAKEKPVREGGTVTSGTQTFPADGNAAVVVASRARARALAREQGILVRLLAFAEARSEKGMMPLAPVPAARAALAAAGLGVKDMRATKLHNPFAAGDAYFCREMGLAPDAVNRFGSPLVYGHPQSPTGMRLVIELIEELVLAGGGRGLFAGCAGGDSAAAIVLAVEEAR